MPRENRKRGKRTKKPAGAEQEEQTRRVQAEPDAIELPEEKNTAGPSWIKPAASPVDDINYDAPFGIVDADVKAYFRTVDLQIRDWQETHSTATSEETDPNAERQMFFMAAMTEMGRKEKQLATDPDCSVVLERMTYSMDDFVRRVFLDSLTGSLEVISKNRFSSHVLQTLLNVAGDTISREVRGIMPTIPESASTGELRTMSQLIIDLYEEMFPFMNQLVLHPFASHVIRALLCLLAPSLIPPVDDIKAQSTMRSKKSTSWKARQGQMTSIFEQEKGKTKQTMRRTPPEFGNLSTKLVGHFRETLSENEVRALAADKAGSPALHLLLELEASLNMSNQEGSLLDTMSAGVINISLSHGTLDPTDIEQSTEFLHTLMRDKTSSHIMESLLSHCPEPAFALLWDSHFKGKIARLASHPIANFVLSKALEKIPAEQLKDVLEELTTMLSKAITPARIGVLRAAIGRVGALDTLYEETNMAVCSAFRLTSAEEQKNLVECAMKLRPVDEFHTWPSQRPTEVQGSLILQSLLRFPPPYNELVVSSLMSRSIEERIKLCQDPSGSRVIDVLLESDTVPSKSKRQFVLSLIGHFHTLVDDKIGSRVGDRCWAFADTYLKEKIARSMIPHEQSLTASFYGKFFGRSLNLYLLQRNPDEWKEQQSKQSQLQKATAVAPPPLPVVEVPKKQKRKRGGVGDEIDELFSAVGGKMKKSSLIPAVIEAQPVDLDQSVLGAIRAAPSKEHRTKKRKVR